MRRAAVLVFALLAASAARAGEAPAPLTAGKTEKVCQLTGETDWQTGEPTAARTMSRFGLDATDLGYPVEHDGKLILLFGDSWPPRHPSPKLEDAVPGDAVGIVMRTAPPTPRDCLGLTINDEPGPPPRFAPATIVDAPDVKQGFFNVPSGGVSVGGRLFAFFWTHHCALPSDLEAAEDQPLKRPAPSATCPETDAYNSIGASVLASSADDARTFHVAAPSPPGFVYVTAVRNGADGDILIYGAPRYRASTPYLAEAAPADFADPRKWRFFVGRDAQGGPRWASYQAWAGADAGPGWRPPAGAALYPDRAGSEACVGEFSITWSQPLGLWLLLYNCRSDIEARVAKAPWGPWSDPTTILSRSDDVECRWLMSAGGCGGRRNFWPAQSRNGRIAPGGFYAPFALARFSEAANGSVTLYWLVSTWNPYEVSVMKTELRR